ncbi:MAG: hypothetical protein GYA50_02600 [Eubacteriaceae bacterium]|nr:hypothetical protein [Eubacteriaceae bacterium]
MAKNKIKCSVIAGVNKGSDVIATDFFVNCLTIMVGKKLIGSYAIDIKHTNTECYELIDDEVLEYNTSKILHDEADLRKEIEEYIYNKKQAGSIIAAVKFKESGDISILEIDEKRLTFLINAMRPHPLTQFIQN